MRLLNKIPDIKPLTPKGEKDPSKSPQKGGWWGSFYFKFLIFEP